VFLANAGVCVLVLFADFLDAVRRRRAETGRRWRPRDVLHGVVGASRVASPHPDDDADEFATKQGFGCNCG